MPIVADPIGAYLQTSLSKTSSTSNDAILQTKLQASAKRALLTRIEYEPAEKQHGQLLQALQSKYIVLGERDFAPLVSANGELSPARNGAGDAAAGGSSGRPQPPVQLSRRSQLRLGWGGSSYPVGAGLVNMGNTCYLNSSLQALFHAPALVRWLLEDSRHASRCGQSGHATEQCLVCSVARTLRLTHQRQGGAVKPMLLYSKLKLICKHFIHGRQEDAHEFVRHLLDSMQRCHLAALRATKLDNLSKETTPMNYLFGGYLKTQVTCLRCQHASMTYQHFQDLPVDIRQVSNLDDALHLYFKKERLDGADYKCEKCRMKVPATKKFYIDETPLILCIQLKRFSLGGGKITKHISFPNKLNVSRFLTRPPVQGQVQYCLVSLINHMGASQNCGHYTAMAKAANGQVYLFDDASVRMTSLGNMLNTNAYVLLYEMTAATRQLLHGAPSGEKAAAGADSALSPTKAPLAPPPPPSPKPAAAPKPAALVRQTALPDSAGRPRVSFTVTSQSSPGIIVKRPLPANKSAVLGRSAATPLVPYKADSSGDEEDSGVPTEKENKAATDSAKDERTANAEKPKLSMPSLDGVISAATLTGRREATAGGGSGAAQPESRSQSETSCLPGPRPGPAAGGDATAATAVGGGAAGSEPVPVPADQVLTVQTSGSPAEDAPRATSSWLVTERDPVSSPASLRSEPVVATPMRGWRVTPLPACSPQSDTTSDRAPGHSPHAVKRAGSLDLSEAPRQLLGKISRKIKAFTQKRPASDGALPTAKRMRTEAEAGGRRVGNSTFFDDASGGGSSSGAAEPASVPSAERLSTPGADAEQPERAQSELAGEGGGPEPPRSPKHRAQSPPRLGQDGSRDKVKVVTGEDGAKKSDDRGRASEPKSDEKGRSSKKSWESSGRSSVETVGRGSNSESHVRSPSKHREDGVRSGQSGSSEGLKTADSGYSSRVKSSDRSSSPSTSARDKHGSKPAASDRPESTHNGESREEKSHCHPRSSSTGSDDHRTTFRPSKSHSDESGSRHPSSPDLSSLSRRRKERHYRPRSNECSPERPAAAAPRSLPSSGGDVMSYLTKGAGLSGYGGEVSTWSGERPRLEREREREEERRRAERDEYNDELDAGRTKKVKYRSPRPVLDHNPFQRYQEDRRRSPEPGRRQQGGGGGRWSRGQPRHHGYHRAYGYRGDDRRRHSRDRVSR